MTAAALAGLALLCTILPPRLLSRAHWAYRSPALGIAAWYAVVWTALSATVLALGATAYAWPSMWDRLCQAWRWCIALGGGTHALIDRTMAWTAGVLGGAVVGYLVLAVLRSARRMAHHRRRTADLVTLLGTRSHDLPATIVDHPRPAAFLLPGRCPRVVLTTGALTVLTADQAQAVIAHEQAHARGRHQLLLDTAALLTHAIRGVRLLTYARTQLGRLVELRADEVAARCHRRIDLAHALVWMSSAAARFDGDLVAANGGDALERLNRLLDPPTPLSRPARLGAYLVLGGMSASPLLIVVGQLLPAVTSSLGH